MYITNHNIGGYQRPSTSTAQHAKVAVDPVESIPPTAGGIKADVTNSVTKTPVNPSNSYQQPQNKPKQEPLFREPLPQDFDFEQAASSGVDNKTVYDQPSGANRFAIASYQQVVNAPKREEIQRLVGIDTFA
ncbi:MAG: hypothetical protein HRU23_16455 [Gammaproteobacteria bacterium]|nr:hypothetical protein [Gammaproteobacteria bacterium]